MTGIARHQGLLHYFACPMTADGDEYAQHFTLKPDGAPLEQDYDRAAMDATSGKAAPAGGACLRASDMPSTNRSTPSARPK